MQIQFRYANQVMIGYEVLIAENNELIPAMVTDVSNLIMEGTETFLQCINTLQNMNLPI